MRPVAGPLAIVVNPGALTHYSWSLHDALAAFDGPVVELHLTQPRRREPWRHQSVVSPVATAVIAGFGGEGYRLAVEGVASLLAFRPPPARAARPLGERRAAGDSPRRAGRSVQAAVACTPGHLCA